MKVSKSAEKANMAAPPGKGGAAIALGFRLSLHFRSNPLTLFDPGQRNGLCVPVAGNRGTDYDFIAEPFLYCAGFPENMLATVVGVCQAGFVYKNIATWRFLFIQCERTRDPARAFNGIYLTGIFVC